jgi:hypothetical protein
MFLVGYSRQLEKVHEKGTLPAQPLEIVTSTKKRIPVKQFRTVPFNPPQTPRLGSARAHEWRTPRMVCRGESLIEQDAALCQDVSALIHHHGSKGKAAASSHDKDAIRPSMTSENWTSKITPREFSSGDDNTRVVSRATNTVQNKTAAPRAANAVRITVRFCVCVCVCMYVCIYVCMYVCSYVSVLGSSEQQSMGMLLHSFDVSDA